MFRPVTDEAPAPSESGSTDVDGCRIGWSAWGERGAPGVVLVHGARAHAGWWSGVLTPALREGRRVVTLDLAGHGDSGRRGDYSPALWGEDIAAVAEAAGGGGPVVVVGHSMGGWATVFGAAAHPDRFGAAILLDSRVNWPEPGEEWEPLGMEKRPLRVYPSREDAVAAFRLLPEQPADPALLRAVAETSLRREGDGWRWKFDPAIAQRYSDGEIREQLARVRCPIHLVYGSNDPIVSAATAEALAEMTDAPTASTVIPGAHHHALLDHPQEVAGALLGTGLLDAARATQIPDADRTDSGDREE